jgi:ribose transport system permease protein
MADLTSLRGFGWRRIPGAAYMLAVLAACFATTGTSFVAGANLANIGMQSTILLLLALPMTLIMLTEGIDLSMGAILTLACVVLAAIAVKTGSVVLALAGALALGAAFGFANGALVAWLGLPPFVTTLGTLGIASGLALVITNAQSITGVGENVVYFYAGTLFGVPLPLLVGVGAYLCTHWLLYQTRFGTYVFALGGNREALRLAGVRANAYLIGVYVLGGTMAGFAALLLTARMSAAHPTAGIGMEFDAIAAVAIGGTSFERGNGWLFGTVLGVLLVGVLRNGLNLLAVPSSLQVVAIGVLIITALMIESFKGKA